MYMMNFTPCYKMRFLLLVVCCTFFMPAFSQNYISGKVSCQGKGLSGVVVTNGADCSQTNEAGYYKLPCNGISSFVYISVPAGYLPEVKNTLPVFYQRINNKSASGYNFKLRKNALNDTNHNFIVQADVQVTSMEDINAYKTHVQDILTYARSHLNRQDLFGIDCGDIVGDTPSLYPAYIRAVSPLNFPVYRAIGNHDMTYNVRSFERSFSTFEHYFGPVNYSFNKGKVHYIVLDNCFYVGRDYQYIGYVDERILSWMEKDLSYVPHGSLVFVIMHIPSSLTKKLEYNVLLQDETSNASALYQLLKHYKAHIISGHTHFNLNVCFNDSLMEHNTAAVCGIWWRDRICMDGTPSGYGIYHVHGDQVEWSYKGTGYPSGYQFSLYSAGSSSEYPEDIIANVWNWDEKWKVEWYENGKKMGLMKRFEGYDPKAKAVCADKEKVVYDWISPVKTKHLFHATPVNPMAKIEVRVTDRFGNIYKQLLIKTR